MTDTIQDRLRGVTAFFRFETGDRVAASASLSEEAAAHIDAQDAKIKALVEALEPVEQEMRDTGNCIAEVPQERAPSRDEICRDFDDYADRIRAALAAAKETT